MTEPAGAAQDLEAWIEERVGAFRGRYGRPPRVLGCAPGRVNLIGEHTDYTEGLVLPCAIDRHTLVLAAPAAGDRIRVFAEDLEAGVEIEAGAPRRSGDWSDYVKAVVDSLAALGHRVPALDMTIASRLPMRSGLSSSAALGLAVARAFDRAAGLGLDSRTLAELVHRGECEFVGIGCGILDQFASALGRRGHALRIDCRTRAVLERPFAGEGLALLILHSGVERRLADGLYGQRVAECQAAIAAARQHGIAKPGDRTLRDLTPQLLPALERDLEPVLFRRARHVVTENARVDDFCAAMERGDSDALGQILAAGQRSLRDDYAVSTPELDAQCEMAEDVPAILGSRLTGAGFGGCTLHLVRAGREAEADELMSAACVRRFGSRPRRWIVTPCDGAFSRALP
ncbi:MAG: galactokinase [Deltaproteobacteria bacterium]|jgi:galactokinase|nr:galactokinase [Deltaproteobacteria bacterium]MBW2384567.1 galactokinase [Deltaproteobacteria bacterium]MBW2695125.1 galactokinase [Deltaproteobacteria bacterium]